MATKGMILYTQEALDGLTQWAEENTHAARKVAAQSARSTEEKKQADALRKGLTAEVYKAIGRAVRDGASIELVRHVCYLTWDNGDTGKETLTVRTGASARVSEALLVAQYCGAKMRTAAPQWAEGKADKGLEFHALLKAAKAEKRRREEEKEMRETGAPLREILKRAEKAGMPRERALAILAEVYDAEAEEEKAA